jgi:hypothetical protein
METGAFDPLAVFPRLTSCRFFCGEGHFSVFSAV